MYGVYQASGHCPGTSAEGLGYLSREGLPRSQARLPESESHDPAGHFPEGRIFFWFEFKSTSTDFYVMYEDYFCGSLGPRTIFEVEACDCVCIELFSETASEKEVLFRIGSKFVVEKTVKKLRPEDLVEGPRGYPEGGFPDEVSIRQLPPTEVHALTAAAAAHPTPAVPPSPPAPTPAAPEAYLKQRKARGLMWLIPDMADSSPQQVTAWLANFVTSSTPI